MMVGCAEGVKQFFRTGDHLVMSKDEFLNEGFSYVWDKAVYNLEKRFHTLVAAKCNTLPSMFASI